MTNGSVGVLGSVLQRVEDADRIFLLSDANVAPLLADVEACCRRHAPTARITVAAGERCKSLAAVADVISGLQNGGATRRSLLVAAGGGSVTDLGGFCAAVFKRGIRYVNYATTLLGAVDAAIGGKTAIDFGGLKNDIGAFHQPLATVTASELLASLPRRELLSGYAEMVKTAAISSPALYHRLLDADRVLADPALLAGAADECAAFKKEVTDADPLEKGLRRILNFGHTAGHAFEALLLDRSTPVTHGTAVAHGMLAAFVASHFHCGLPSHFLYTYRDYLLQFYNRLPIFCNDCKELVALMLHDKKNRSSERISMVLLNAIGAPAEPVALLPQEMKSILDIYLDLTGT